MTSESRQSTIATLALMAWWGHAAGVNGAAAPLLAKSFGVSESALASSLGWIGLASLGALVLGRWADRVGRRRVALFASATLPLAAAASALATSLASYVVAQMLVYASGTTLLAALVVLVAEHASPDERAKAQARAGVAFLTGTAVPLIACAWLAPHGVAQAERWRWLWWMAVAPAVIWPFALRSLRDAPRWVTRAADSEAPIAVETRGDRGRVRLPILVSAAALIAAAEVASRSWLFFHAVATLGLSPRRALLVIATGGAASLLGFSGGARIADRYGRRIAFLGAASLFAFGATGYFGASLDVAGDPAALLLVSFAAMGIGGNAAITAFRAHATELTPVDRRGALAGSLAVANAAGWVAAMFVTSALAHALGSLAFAVTALVGVAVPAAIALVLWLPETAGGRPSSGRIELREADAAA